MGELILSGPLADLVRKNRIDEDDVALLRRTVFSDGIVNSEEATSLLALNQSCQQKSEAWDTFFVEALSDYLVFQSEPRGYVSQANADAIMKAIYADEIICHRTELELLLNVLQKATSVPSSLAAFALRQVAHAVLRGEGAMARGRQLCPGVVTAGDVENLRTILYAAGSEDSIAISRDEANVLFDINDATSAADNDPAWRQLFVKAITASVMMVAGYQPQSADDVLARQAWRDDASVNVGAFFSRIAAGGLRGYMEAVKQDTSLEAMAAERTESRAAQAKKAEIVDLVEAQWLAERIARDKQLCENEKELLAFVAEQAPMIATPLRDLIEKAA